MDIDFVVLWVDGNDPDWKKEKAKYQGKTLDDSNSENRFRDWGLMPYWSGQWKNTRLGCGRCTLSPAVTCPPS